MCSDQLLTVKSEVFVLNLNISVWSFSHISMRNLKILQAALAVIGMHVIAQLIVCRKPVFSKKEHFCSLESKSETENNNAINRSMHPMIIQLLNIKKVKIDFHFQQTFILTNRKCLLNTIPTGDSSYTKQVDLKSSASVNMTNLFPLVNASTQTQYTILEHTNDGFFSCPTSFLFPIFDFSQNVINVHCSTSETIFLIAMVLFVFTLVLFFSKTNYFST